MRPADIYRLHYQSAFARLNPGKPLVLPPSGFGSRVLPAPGPAPARDTTAATPGSNSTDHAYGGVRSTQEAQHFDRLHPQAVAAKPIIVEVTAPVRSAPTTARGARDGYQRSNGSADSAGAAPVQDAVSVDAYDVPVDAKTTFERPPTANPMPKFSTPAWLRGLRLERQTVLVAGALALGVGGTSLFFAHPDPHAVVLAWHTYKAAMATRPDRSVVASRATTGNAKPAPSVVPDTATSNAIAVRQRNVASPVDATRSPARDQVGIAIPHAPAAIPRALTSQDLMPEPQGGSPLGNVSPEALRRPSDLSVQPVTVDPEMTAPANPYESPIRKPLAVLHHRAESNNEGEPVQVRPAHASEEANPKKNARPPAADVAAPAVAKAAAQSAQQARQDPNADQKIF
jgi:hypothetical protein